MSTMIYAMIADIDVELEYGCLDKMKIQSYITKLRNKEIEVLKEYYFTLEERDMFFQGFIKNLRTYGTCELSRFEPTLARICLSKALMYPENGEAIVNVLAHEVLHGLLPFKTHHGYAFKAAMYYLNRELGTHIMTRGIHGLKNRKPPKYEVYCPQCGIVVGRYYRKGKVVQHPEDFVHRDCKCTLKCREVG